MRRRTGHGNVRTAAGVVSGVTAITGARQIVTGKMVSILSLCPSLVSIVVTVRRPVHAYPAVLRRAGGIRGRFSKRRLLYC